MRAGNPVEQLERRQLLAEVVGLTLINAQTDQPLGGLAHGQVIDLAQTGKQLNIRADVATTGTPTKSVRFNFDGNPTFKIESLAPYAIAGDTNNGKDFLPWTPALGTHTLVVTPYESASGTGVRGAGKMLTFEVIDSSQTPGQSASGVPDSSQSAAPLSIIRVNAAGPQYIDAARGLVRVADTGFSASTKSTGAFAVGGTLDDPLYYTRRYGSKFTFTQLAENGRYNLTLHFAEPTFTATGKRVFDVSAEGQLVIDNLDLFKSAGAKKAYTKTIPITITDGALNVSFAASINNAIISAIELTPAGPPPPPPLPPATLVPNPIYIDAGGATKFLDSVGRVFQPDSHFTGGTIGAGTGDVLNTTDDALFHSFRSGASFTFSKSVGNGHYALFLEFADGTSTAAGQRTFDVSAEGAIVLDDFDIFPAAGAVANSAVAKKFDVTITDNKLDLSFAGVVGDAIISAIALVPTDIPKAIEPYVFIHDYEDPVKHAAVLEAWKFTSMSYLRQMHFGIMWYSNEHRGNLPPDLKTMALTQDIDLYAFANPRVPVLEPRGQTTRVEIAAYAEAQKEYIYVGAGLRNNVGADVIIAYENPDIIPSDELAVLWGDGHVSGVPREKIVEKFGGSPITPTPLPRPLAVFRDVTPSKSADNLRAIQQALQIYSNDFQGKLPPDLGTLYLYLKTSQDPLTLQNFMNPRGKTPPPPPSGMTDAQAVVWINAQTDYRYVAGGLKLKATVLVYENPAEMKDGINVLYDDGRVEYIEMRWAFEAARGASAASFA